MASERPWLSANFAITWDGRISTRGHTPSDFSSRRDKRRLLELRAEADAVMAGARTVSADNMTMGLPPEELRNARKARGQAEYPLRVIVSNSGRLDPGAPLFQKAFSPILVFSTTQMREETQGNLRKAAHLYLDDDERVDLRGMLRKLRSEHGVSSIDFEGGGALFRALLEHDLVDALHLTCCPRIFGGEKSVTITGALGSFLPRSMRCRLESMEVVEDECFLRYTVAH